MTEDTYDSIILFVICAGFLMSGILLGAGIGKSSMRKEAIYHRAAQYNPTNANFEWINHK